MFTRPLYFLFIVNCSTVELAESLHVWVEANQSKGYGLLPENAGAAFEALSILGKQQQRSCCCPKGDRIGYCDRLTGLTPDKGNA